MSKPKPSAQELLLRAKDNLRSAIYNLSMAHEYLGHAEGWAYCQCDTAAACREYQRLLNRPFLLKEGE